YSFAFSGFSTILFQASIGSLCSCIAACHKFHSFPRIYGYLTCNGLYSYHEREAPLGQPRGSNSGVSGPQDGSSICWLALVIRPLLTNNFQLHASVQFAPCE